MSLPAGRRHGRSMEVQEDRPRRAGRIQVAGGGLAHRRLRPPPDRGRIGIGLTPVQRAVIRGGWTWPPTRPTSSTRTASAAALPGPRGGTLRRIR